MIEFMNLGFGDDDLEPVISKKTIDFHYKKHHKAYVDKTNELILGTDFQNMSLEEIIEATFNDAEHVVLYNNAGQVYNHNVYWNSVKIGEKFDADMSSISASCRKENRTSKGYVFRYSGDDFDYVPYTAWNRKPVIQKSINGEFIAEFECSRVAQETLKLPTNANISIRDCCRGKQKTAYGYKWEYKE